MTKILKGDASREITLALADGYDYAGATVEVRYQGERFAFRDCRAGGSVSFRFTAEQTAPMALGAFPVEVRVGRPDGTWATFDNARVKIEVTDDPGEVNEGGVIALDVRGGLFGLSGLPARWTDADVREKVNEIIRRLGGTAAALALCALPALGASFQSAPKAEVYSDAPVVTNVTFEGLATTAEVEAAVAAKADRADLEGYVTRRQVKPSSVFDGYAENAFRAVTADKAVEADRAREADIALGTPVATYATEAGKAKHANEVPWTGITDKPPVATTIDLKGKADLVDGKVPSSQLPAESDPVFEKWRSSADILLGPGASSSWGKSLVFGRNAESRSGASVVIGDGALVGESAGGSIAIGQGAFVGTDGGDSIAIGKGAEAIGDNDVAIGRDGLGVGCFRFGGKRLDDIVKDTIFRTPAQKLDYSQNEKGVTYMNRGLDQDCAVAVGVGAVATVDPAYVKNLYKKAVLRSVSVAVGGNADARADGSPTSQAIAVGWFAQAKGGNSIAIGCGAQHTNETAMSGNATVALGPTSVAVGYSAKATAAGAVQIGQGTNAVPHSLQFEGVTIVRDGKVAAGLSTNDVLRAVDEALAPREAAPDADGVLAVRSHALTVLSPGDGPLDEAEVAPTGSRNYELYLPNSGAMREGLPVSFETADPSVAKLGGGWRRKVLRLPALVRVRSPGAGAAILSVEEYDDGWDWAPSVTNAALSASGGVVRLESLSGTNLHGVESVTVSYVSPGGATNAVASSAVRSPLYGGVRPDVAGIPAADIAEGTRLEVSVSGATGGCTFLADPFAGAAAQEGGAE